MTCFDMTRWNKWMISAVAGAAIGGLGMTSQAHAGDWGFHVGVNNGPRVVETRTYVEPAYELRTRQVWVEPEYAERTVPVHVPPVIDIRRVPARDIYGKIVGYREVRQVIEPARTEYRTQSVVVREGYFRTVTERVLVEAPLVERPVVTTAYVAPSPTWFSFGFAYDRHHDHHRHHHGGRRAAVHVGFGR